MKSISYVLPLLVPIAKKSIAISWGPSTYSTCRNTLISMGILAPDHPRGAAPRPRVWVGQASPGVQLGPVWFLLWPG